ncbi:hypothetical protein T12_14130 [Trichinella patagoniensis]|uniref:Uncharacterized protein n=1 Tax=Trichinella patagoniensis TaxID=990121 RepID=A0A0V1AFX9_9BILA|nr:hypothetical protein T12_14130 [Trichinella patagoniensis]
MIMLLIGVNEVCWMDETLCCLLTRCSLADARALDLLVWFRLLDTAKLRWKRDSYSQEGHCGTCDCHMCGHGVTHGTVTLWQRGGGREDLKTIYPVPRADVCPLVWFFTILLPTNPLPHDRVNEILFLRKIKKSKNSRKGRGGAGKVRRDTNTRSHLFDSLACREEMLT